MATIHDNTYDIDVLNELVVPDTQEVPMTTGEHVAADLVPVSERMEDMDLGSRKKGRGCTGG